MVDIYANKSLLGHGDTLEIFVKVENPDYKLIDMYAAFPMGELFYWYPVWDNIPHPTEIGKGTWERKIIIQYLSFPPAGKYTYYAAITEHNTINIIGLDSVTVTVK